MMMMTMTWRWWWWQIWRHDDDGGAEICRLCPSCFNEHAGSARSTVWKAERSIHCILLSAFHRQRLFFQPFDLVNFLVILSCAFGLAQTENKGLGPWYFSFDQPVETWQIWPFLKIQKVDSFVPYDWCWIWFCFRAVVLSYLCEWIDIWRFAKINKMTWRSIFPVCHTALSLVFINLFLRFSMSVTRSFPSVSYFCVSRWAVCLPRPIFRSCVYAKYKHNSCTGIVSSSV